MTTSRREKASWDEISGKSAKIVSFIDLAGHERWVCSVSVCAVVAVVRACVRLAADDGWEHARGRYLKTTLFGLTGCQPDYVMLIVGGNAGLIGMSKEHLGVALALQVPVIVRPSPLSSLPSLWSLFHQHGGGG
jgi:GTPase